jgi:hypothetical protein
MWQNPYHNLIQIKFKNAGLKIQVILEPNEIRHLERDKINYYFGDRSQKNKFYNQAKDGKLHPDNTPEQ